MVAGAEQYQVVEAEIVTPKAGMLRSASDHSMLVGCSRQDAVVSDSKPGYVNVSRHQGFTELEGCPPVRIPTHLPVGLGCHDSLDTEPIRIRRAISQSWHELVGDYFDEPIGVRGCEFLEVAIEPRGTFKRRHEGREGLR